VNKFTIRQLEFFVGAGQYGNLTEAAKHLHISQPAITSAISHLEQVLDQKLFHRIPGEGVKPTAAGKRALVDARRILVSLNDFQGKFSDEDQGQIGTVSLGCFEPLACLRLPGLLKRLADDMPDVKMDFSLTTQPHIRKGILNGEFELGLSYDSGFWEDIEKEILCYVTPSALLPADHRLASRSSIEIMELSEEPFVLVDLPESREFQLALMARFGLEPQVRYYCGNIEVLRGIVAHGLAVSISVTHPVIDSCYDGQELVVVPFSDPMGKQAVVLAYARNENLTRAAQATIERIKAHFTELGLDATP